MKVPFVSFLPMEKEIGEEIKLAFERVFSRSWYIEGEEDKNFEKAFAEYIGVDHCIGVGNGLDALMLALKSLGIGKGDEVIVPSNTFIATALAVSYVGATLVLVEPEINTYNIDPSLIEEKITDRTKAIIPVAGWVDDILITVTGGLNLIQSYLKESNEHLAKIVKGIKWVLIVLGILIIAIIALVVVGIANLFA